MAKNAMRDTASRRRVEVTLGTIASQHPNWVSLATHAQKIAACKLWREGKVERARDDYRNRWFYRWIRT